MPTRFGGSSDSASLPPAQSRRATPKYAYQLRKSGQSFALFWLHESVRDAAVLRPFTAQLIRRKLAWPFAAGTPVKCVILLIIGVVGDPAAVGA